MRWQHAWVAWIAVIAVVASPSRAAQKLEPWQLHQAAAAVAMRRLDLATAEKELVAAFEDAARFSASDPRLTGLLRLIGAFREEIIRMGGAQEADAFADSLVEKAESVRGADHPVTFALQCGIAASDIRFQRWDKAAPRLVDLRERAARSLGEGDAWTLRASAMLAEVLLGTDRLDEAYEMAKAARDEARKSLGEEAPEVAAPVAVMALVELKRDHLDEALVFAGEAAATKDPDGLEVAEMFVRVAATLRERGRAKEALPWNERAVDVLQRAYGRDVLSRMYGLGELVQTQLALGHRVAAHRLVQPMVEIAKRSNHPLAGYALMTAAEVEIALHRYEQALPLARAAVSKLRMLQVRDDSPLRARAQVAYLESKLGHLEHARKLEEDLLLDTGIAHGARSSEYASALNDLAYADALLGDVDAAESRLSQSFALEPLADDGDGARRDTLGLLRLRQGRVDEAIEQLEAAVAAQRETDPGRVDTLEHLHEALLAGGRKKRAAEVSAALDRSRLDDQQAVASLALESEPEGGGEAFVSEELGFRLAEPPAGWHDFDPTPTDPAAVAGYRRSDPDAFFAIVPTPQPVPGVSLEALGSALWHSLEQRTYDLQVASEGRRTLAGMDGWLLEVTGLRGDERFDWAIWTTLQNGVAYHFYVWCPHGRFLRSALVTDLDAFARRFSLLEP